MRQARFRFLLLPLFFVLACTAALAQENAELTGTITDPAGAVVSNAAVTLTNVATGEMRTDKSNSVGIYDFAGLNHGTYTLKVVAQGFSRYEKTGIVMNVAATVQENAQLKLGASNQTVTVEADALHLQTETNEVSNLITGDQITELATNGRSITSLATLGTGVSGTLPEFNGTSAQGSSATISFNGMRTGHNDFLVDGGEIYDRGSGGKLGVMPSPDAIAEFQVLASNYAPDYGIASGGTTTIVLKSGAKTFHGGLWEFNRNDDFDAVNWFTKQAAAQNHTAPAIPELRLNIYGGNVGGPVFIPVIYPKEKSKTFFFWTEEWRKMIQGSPANLTNAPLASEIPTTADETGHFVYVPPTGLPESPAAGVCNAGQVAPCVPKLPNNAAYTSLETSNGLTPGNSFPVTGIPGALLDPNAVLFMGTGAIPASNTTGPNGQPVVIASPKQPTYVREDVVRIDHDISSKMHLMGHWIHDQMSQTYFPNQNWGDGDSYTTAGDTMANPSWGSVIKLTYTISPNLLNEASINVNGNHLVMTALASPGASISEPSGWTQKGYFPAANNIGNRLPGVHMGAPFSTTWSIGYWPWKNSYLNYQPRDDVSWTKGKHSLKFGFAYMRNDKNQQQQADTEGDYNFGTDFSGDSYINFLLGLSDQFTQLDSLSMFHWINNTWSFYGMDNWKLTHRLTVNLGLRYDALPHVYNKENQAGNFVPADFTAANEQVPNASTGQMNPAGPGFSNPTNAPVPFYLNGIELAGVGGFPRGVVQNDFKTYMPRVGFAYDLFANGKTVLRGGFGTFYERVQGNDIYGTDTNPPFAYQPQASDVFFTNPATSVTTGATASTPTFPASMGTLNYHYPNPGTAQYKPSTRTDPERWPRPISRLARHGR